MKTFLIFGLFLYLGTYASSVENKSGQVSDAPAIVAEESIPKKDNIQNYKNYFTYGAVGVIIMVIGSSIGQIQKYNQK